MSRIEEALKRAKEAEVVVPASVPSTDVFKDAWTVDDGVAAGEAGATVVEEPAAEPAAAKAAKPAPDPAPAPPSEVRPAPGERRRHGRAEPAPAALALFQGFNPSMAEKIVATPTIRPAFVEQYRRLAGTLHHAQLEKNIKVVMVTSAIAGEGKTLTATNLALTLSESYRRSVLLIDADLRRPSLHETFQVPNVTGLGDGLRAPEETKLSLVGISQRLMLLTAGRPDPDPMSGLTSDRMKRLLEEAAERFDWVIVDTPPVGLLPDANLLAGLADATLLVIAAGTTPFQIVRRAVAAVGRDRILGVVLNRGDAALDTSYRYYSHYRAYGLDRVQPPAVPSQTEGTKL